MSLKLVAFESLGVRSQATYIQTADASIFIDPSAALAPRRYGLPPHRIEVLKLLKVFEEINALIQESDYIIITHYHYDHHDPGRFIDIDSYKNKIFLIKDPQHNINLSQKLRAYKFLNKVKDKAKEIRIIDGTTINVGKTQISFSQPLPHGEGNKLGYVISLCIKDCNHSILFTSDIEGGPLREHLQILEMCSPKLAIVDGPPTYLLNYRYSEHGFRNSLKFLSLLLKLPDLETVILDHHICRELSYIDKISDLIKEYNNAGKRIVNAANFIGVEAQFLEALRKYLYSKEPVNGLSILKSSMKYDMELGDEY